MIDWVLHSFSPPVFEDEDETRAAELLHVILVLLLLGTVLYTFTAPFVFPQPIPWFLIGAVLACLWLAGLLLTRRGHVRRVSLGFVPIMWTVVTILVLLGGGLDSPRVVNYCGAIVIAGLLLGGWVGVGVAIASILASLAMLLAQTAGLLPLTSFGRTPSATWILLTGNFGIIAVLLFLATRSIKASLQRARNSERALAQRNRELETEIRERQQAEQKLSHERDLLHALMESIPDTIYVKDAEARFTRINKAQAQLLGIGEPELAQGKSDFDFFVHEHAQQAYEDDQAVLTSGQSIIDKVEELTGIDGRTRWLSVTKSPLFDQAHKVVGLVGISRNITKRVETEAAMRESEERFRSIFENTVMGLYRTTPDGEILMANPALLRMLDYSSLKELAERNLEESGFVSQYPRSTFKERMERDGQVVGLESAWMRSDGSTLHIRESARAFADTDGNTQYYEGTVEDITDRILAEEALRENEARYRSLFEESPISLWEEDFSGVKQYLDHLCESGVSDIGAYLNEHPDSVTQAIRLVKIVDVNQETVNLYKAGSREDLYEGLERVFVDESIDSFRDELIALVEGKTRVERHTVQQTLDGDEMDTILRLVVAPGYETSWEKVFISIIDITRQKRIEAERETLLADLMRRGTQLLTAAEVSKSAGTILDTEELINETVHLIQRRFGFYYVGLFLLDETEAFSVLHAGSGDAGQSMLVEGHRLAVGGDSMIGRCVGTKRARIALDVGKEAVRFDNPHLPDTRSEMALPLLSRGQCIGALTVQSTEPAAFSADDLTVLQSMAEQLAIAITNARLYAQVQRYATGLEERVAERTAELAAVNKELEAFAYSVSHDLRAPLRSIDGFSQALLEDYENALDSIGKDYLNRVRAGSQRMGKLIDDLLALSRLTRLEMRRRMVHVDELAREIAYELEQTEPGRRVEFIVEGRIVADADPHLLRVALENLLGNAWKFTSRQEMATITVGVEQEDGERVYYVQDDGAGFDMAHADKLFGAFQRLHAMTEFEGSGIGLATVQRIIHRHGGRIWAEGAADEGATFYFTLTPKVEGGGKYNEG